MNAEALIGTVLGTCTLQQLIGQGGMGAVFLAQQSRPRRQVAVKVLLPMTALTPNQRAAFLERFRRETDAAASMEHPNILPVYEYGEQRGLAYLVMPYVGGGTLRDVMENEGPMALPKAMRYLEQLAGALDYAHERGVVHRDIKPANILMTQEERLLLADFGLVKIVSEGQASQVRLTGAGAPVGTPEYMAPEQVMGGSVDGRADLYALGVVLYQMVTGVTPFQGDAPMQIAVQHLQTPPPPASVLRKDLPVGAEQVIMKSLSKKPDERYLKAEEMVYAFRLALQAAGVTVGNTDEDSLISSVTGVRLFTPRGRGLFDPSWQSGVIPAIDINKIADPVSPAQNVVTTAVAQSAPAQAHQTGLLGNMNRTTPDNQNNFYNYGQTQQSEQKGSQPTAPKATGLLSSYKTGLLTGTGLLSGVPASNSAQAQEAFDLESQATGPGPAMNAATAPPQSFQSSVINDNFFARPTGTLAGGGNAFQQSQNLVPYNNGNPTTGALGENGNGSSSTIKLSGPMKVVQMPVAGQPGRYVTGFLPVLPQEPEEASKRDLSTKQKVFAGILLVVLLGAAIIGYSSLSSRSGSQKNANGTTTATNANSPSAPTTSSVNANILISDPLTQNIHSWTEHTQDDGNPQYFFKDGAYHILAKGGHGGAAFLPNTTLDTSYVYALTTKELKGSTANDDANINAYGMIFRYTEKKVNNGNTVHTFYAFQVENKDGGKYQFYKYDDTNGPEKAWGDPIWEKPLGKEFHIGTGDKNVNNFKVTSDGKNFTIMVNDKKVDTVKTDGALKSGYVGMLVNQDNTEVAFSNMLITRK